MKIFIVELGGGGLVPHPGERILVEFYNGRTIKFEQSEDMPFDCLDMAGLFKISPIGTNCIHVTPMGDNMGSEMGMTMFILDEHGHRHSINGRNVVVALNNGKTLEVMEHYRENGLLVWGGREPRPEQSFAQWQENTESLGIYPGSGCHVHIFPFRW